MDSHTRDNDPWYNMIHNYFLELDQSPNHIMTCNPTIALYNNDSYTFQQCLFNFRYIDSFTILQWLFLQHWLLIRPDTWLDIASLNTSSFWGTVCMLQLMVLWCCIVLLVYVWVVLLCPPSYTRKTQTNIQKIYLNCLTNHMSKKYSKFKCKYVQNL